MKKNIIIEENGKVMGLDSKPKHPIVEFIICILCYSLILALVSCLFDSFYLNLNNFGIYAVIASIIIYVLDLTIKPILVLLTLPITYLSYGLFYPIVNVLILYITSFFLGDHFVIRGFWGPFMASIVISVLKITLDRLVIKPIVGEKSV